MAVKTPSRSHIEEASLLAWPALVDKRSEAWRIRLSEGFTKRANSATFLGPSYQSGSFGDSIRTCEDYFAESELSPTFRLPSFCTPKQIEQALADQGYQASPPTLVLSRGLSLSSTPDPPQDTHFVPGRLHSESDFERWVEYYQQFTNQPVAKRDAHLRILTAIAGTRHLAYWQDEGTVVACGLAVITRNVCGLFDLVVAPKRRGRGYGTRLIEALVQWAQTRRAQCAYLQVEQTNEDACRLYARQGFERRYQYSYWQRP